MLSKRRLGPWFLFALLVLLGWVSLRIVGVFLDYVLIALFLAFLTYPLYRRLATLMRRPSAAAVAMVVLVLLGILVPLILLSIEVAEEVRAINQTLGDDSASIAAAFVSAVQTVGFDEATAAGLVDDGTRWLQEFLRFQAAELAGRLAGLLIGSFVLLYIMYYCYTSGPQLVAWVRQWLPMDDGHRDLLLYEVGQVVKGVMAGTILTALIQAIIGGVGFLIFGVPNPLLWTVIMFVLAMLPVVGPPLVWAPWGIYLIAEGDTARGVGLLVYSAIFVSTIDNLLRPKLIGRAANIHPVTVLLGVLGGVVVFGFPGFILGPLVLSIFVTILNVYRKEFAQHMEDWSQREMWLR